MTKPFQIYPGGKNSPGVTQTLINIIPAGIVCYVSPTAGNDPVFRTVKPFKCACINDLDVVVYDAWKAFFAANPDLYLVPGKAHRTVNFYNLDCFVVLDDLQISGFARGINPKNVLIFLDPPYLKDTRRSQADIYNHEWDELMHVNLLHRARCLGKLGYHLMICCYPNDLYAKGLIGWNHLDYKSTTRQGQVTERVYFNYPKPTDLHDFSFYGNNFRIREQIKRKKNSLVKKLMELPENIRQYAINDVMSTLKSLNP
jgi:DNA adenine methylase